MCGMVSYTISHKNIRYRRYPCPISSVFNPQLSVFVFENIRICIRIRSYPYSNSNPTKNMKTNIISLISVRIPSDYTPTHHSSVAWRASSHGHSALSTRQGVSPRRRLIVVNKQKIIMGSGRVCVVHELCGLDNLIRGISVQGLSP
jgi:hypothetical protein